MLSQLPLEIELLSVQFLLMIPLTFLDIRSVFEQLHVGFRLKLPQLLVP
jgi:hypothetical protein